MLCTTLSNANAVKLIHLPEVASTNTYLRQLLKTEPHLPQYTVVDSYAQTAGRGQRGNSWETNPGENISSSVLLRPQLPPQATTYDLNIVVSLALYDLLSRYISEQVVKVKWPNDIMIGDKKICGILIENEWLGSDWDYSIVGIGLNVKQTTFGDYHPVATSMALEGAVLAEDYETWHHGLISELTEAIQERMHGLATHHTELRSEYHRHLLGLGERRNYALPDGCEFTGVIESVLPNGLLQVSTPHGTQHFAFKEIRMLLP